MELQASCPAFAKCWFASDSSAVGRDIRWNHAAGSVCVKFIRRETVSFHT